MSKLFAAATVAGLVVASFAFAPANAQPKNKSECHRECDKMATKDAKFTQCKSDCETKYKD